MIDLLRSNISPNWGWHWDSYMSGELAECMFIYMCSLHWLEGAEWVRLQRKRKEKWWEQLGAYDVPGMAQGLKLMELFIQRFCGVQKNKEGIKEMKHGTEWGQTTSFSPWGEHSHTWAFWRCLQMQSVWKYQFWEHPNTIVPLEVLQVPFQVHLSPSNSKKGGLGR